MRQVQREGPRWGLRPILRHGRAQVAEMVAEVDAPRGRGLGIVHRAPRVIASLDADSPLDAFAMLLENRIQRGDIDFMQRIDRRQARLKAQARADVEARWREVAETAKARLRGRVMSIPGLWR
jgi:hypothetical protein